MVHKSINSIYACATVQAKYFDDEKYLNHKSELEAEFNAQT
jgi:hypothetical protein